MEKKKITVAEAGRLGGLARKAGIGPGGYVEIGKKGGSTTLARYGREHFVKIGRVGGYAKKQETDHGV